MLKHMVVKTDGAEANIGGWRDRHNAAVLAPIGFERAIVRLFQGLEDYRNAHKARYGSDVEKDGVLAQGVEDIALGLRVLLNGQLGRLDAGTLDGILVNILKSCGVEV